jgi:drug/metabolite transporter (DMT)-like permease
MAILETRAFGLIAAIATVTIWAGFMLITRFAVKSDFTVEELLVLRLLPGAIVMIPWMWKLGVMPPKMAWPRAAMLMVGASAVFPYVVSKGLAFAPASDGGALAPGMLPFWAALAAFALAGEVPGPRRRIGLAMILLGALLVSLWPILQGGSDGAWRGHLMFLSGSWSLGYIFCRVSPKWSQPCARFGDRAVLGDFGGHSGAFVERQCELCPRCLDGSLDHGGYSEFYYWNFGDGFI